MVKQEDIQNVCSVLLVCLIKLGSTRRSLEKMIYMLFSNYINCGPISLSINLRTRDVFPVVAIPFLARDALADMHLNGMITIYILF